MAFSDMPVLEPLVLPGGPDYAERVLEMSRRAVATSRTVLDVPLGQDYWQKLDLFLPRDPSLTNLPVLMFVHGGAWCKGYKEWMGFMAPSITAFPALFASVNHRLAPTARYPKPLEDCFAALAWLHANVARFGGSPDRIFVGGHSSGGHLASLVTLRRDWALARGLPEDVCKGCYTVSAPLNLHVAEARGRRLELIRQFLQSDGDQFDASPIDHTKGNRASFLLCWGTDDLPEVIEHNRQIFERLREENCVVQTLVVEGGHFDTSLQCADEDGPWLSAVRQMMSAAPVPSRAPHDTVFT